MLIGCTGQQTPTKQSTTNLSATPIIQTPAALPTFGGFQTPTPPILPTESLLATPKAVPKLPFTLDRLRMVLVKNGNLYIQNGTNPPVQITHSGKDRNPIMSVDGVKIVFYRGENFDNVYSINSDGSQEQAIIISQSLPILGRGDIKALTFIPKTHFLLFNTYLCNPREHLYDAPDCKVGIYSVDTDTGKINELISELSGNGIQTHNFEISPDGHLISVAASGHIDIYSLSMQKMDISQSNAILYNLTTPDEFLPLQYWLPDSSGLIAILSEDKYNEPGTPPQTYSAWRYTIKGNSAIQISLDQPIIRSLDCNFSVSPNRNWIFYISEKEPSLYIGNLNNGRTQSYNWKGGCPSSYRSSPQWSSDSQYFASGGRIGAVDGTVIPIDGDFLGWIDDSYYFYAATKDNSPKIYIGTSGVEVMALPESFRWSSTYILMNQ